MEKAISQFSQLPQTKSERALFVEIVVNEIMSGDVDPLKVEIYLKNIEETITQIRKNEKVKELLLSESEKYGQKTFDYEGNKITVSQRTSYNFTECNHSELDEINSQLIQLTERKKEIEKELQFMSKPVADVDSGCVINPPTKTVTKFLTIKLV